VSSAQRKVALRSAALSAESAVTAADTVRALLRSAGIDATVTLEASGEIVVSYRVDVGWAEMEVPTAPRSAQVAYAELRLQPGDGTDGWVVSRGGMSIPGTGINKKRRRIGGTGGRFQAR
jgi:hypothetical protein